MFPDTSTTVVAFDFVKSDSVLTEQHIEWTLLPSKQKKLFTLLKENNWIIGGDIYNLCIPKSIRIRRYVTEGFTLKEGEFLTDLTLTALDSGKEKGRICLEYKPGYKYEAKDTSRAYATICVIGIKLSEEQQKRLALDFNSFVEKKRLETWSLFLPQFRESKEYARKRIPFELAYKIIGHCLRSTLEMRMACEQS